MPIEKGVPRSPYLHLSPLVGFHIAPVATWIDYLPGENAPSSSRATAITRHLQKRLASINPNNSFIFLPSINSAFRLFQILHWC